MKNIKIITIIMGVFILISFGWLVYLTLNQSRINTVKIVLTTQDNSIINQQSMDDLRNILKMYNDSVKKDDLLVMLESQRNFFIGIVTVISIIFGLFGIVILIQRYFDKDLERELRDLIVRNNSELNKIISSSKITWIHHVCASMGNKGMFLIVDSTEERVINISQLMDFIQENIIQYFEPVSNAPVDEVYNAYTRFIICSMNYAYDKKWCTTFEYNIEKNVVFACTIRCIRQKLLKDNYNEFIKYFKRNIKKHERQDVVI